MVLAWNGPSRLMICFRQLAPSGLFLQLPLGLIQREGRKEARTVQLFALLAFHADRIAVSRRRVIGTALVFVEQHANLRK
jgi:hypothetical protein